MLPLSPPPGYFKEINSIISKFIWNDKCPRIKLTTLQHTNSTGGLAVPNFELYYWSFQLKALHNWVDPRSTVSWRVIEADKVKPNRLQDILFTGTGKKGIIINLVWLWLTLLKSGKLGERRFGGPFKFCNSTPLWHNFNFVCGNRPFVQPSWSSLGVNTCGDIYDNQGLCSFQNFVYQHPHILSFFNYVLLSKRMEFRGLFPFPLILCGTGLHHLLVGHLFP